MNKIVKNQQGLVSIISVILIVLIITVITLSLSTLTRRGLRQSIDEQLSSQAQYAAESGINDAIKYISSGSINNDITSCDQTGGSPSTNKFVNNILSSDGNIRYTCVLVNLVTSTINTDVSTGGLKSYLLQDANGGAISSLNFTWRRTESDVNPVTFPACVISGATACLGTQSAWGNNLGLLRIRLIPVSSASIDFANYIDITAFPSGSGNPSISGGTRPASYFRNSNCSSVTSSCTITVDGLSGPGKYYLQVYSYYRNINLDVSGSVLIGATPSPASFTGAQATIDATGASGDVLKRVKVTVPISSTIPAGNFDSLPIFSLGAGEKLCKRFSTNNSSTTDQGATESPTCSSF